ncbi:hypothetical protein A2U01_0071759, partial [Trifolium medium]|nr:hypothetical protein [Trifolium medium]
MLKLAHTYQEEVGGGLRAELAELSEAPDALNVHIYGFSPC